MVIRILRAVLLLLLLALALYGFERLYVFIVTGSPAPLRQPRKDPHALRR